MATSSPDWPPLLDAADRALVALATGSGEAPLRTALPLTEGQLLTMPGRLEGAATAIVKLVTVVPGNAARGKATIQGVAVVFDARSGEPIAQLDGAQLSAIRTGAVSAAAARALADPATESMALIGAGGQAPWQARALVSSLPIRRLTMWSPTRAHCERLAHELSEELAAEVLVADDVRAATRGAQLICCATTASGAFLHADMLTAKPTLVIAIGAFRPDMAEVDISVFRQAGRVFVDDAQAVLHEGGDVIAALSAGAISREDVLPVGTVIRGAVSAPSDQVTVFKSVGSALEDAAVGELLAMSQPRVQSPSP
jgi:ornithine cyclodeaminase/alanine dehydrogenase-like protein (mu-crystallin family)